MQNKFGDTLFRYRFFSALTLLLTILPFIFLLSIFWFSLVSMTICFLAFFEWKHLTPNSTKFKLKWYLILCCIFLSFILSILIEDCSDFYRSIINILILISIGWWNIAIILIIFYPKSSVIWKNFTFMRFLIGFLIIAPLWGGLIKLRFWQYNENYYSGTLKLLYIMILVWSMDSGGYIFGRILGTHKLASKISPNKTWEGLIGGIFTSGITLYIYSLIIDLKIYTFKMLICSILSMIYSIIGDLTESMFKREAGVKDSSTIIPGHGGILDRIDSLTAAVPIFVFIISNISI